MRGTGSVETGITPATGYGCVHYKDSLTASWAELAHLRDADGWRFVSHSRTYAKNWSSMTMQQQWDQTCGSLLDLEQHGHMSGDGLFAYPDNKWDTTVQTNVVATCFAFGRQYGTGPTDMSSATLPPYWQTSENLGGGRCNIKSLPCASIPNAPYRYDSPVAVAAQLAAPGARAVAHVAVLPAGGDRDPGIGIAPRPTGTSTGRTTLSATAIPTT